MASSQAFASKMARMILETVIWHANGRLGAIIKALVIMNVLVMAR